MTRSWPSLVIAGVVVVAIASYGVATLIQEREPLRPEWKYDGSPPLVVLVIVDTLRKDALSIYNPATPPTPQIDAFATLSTTYTRATAPSSWTTPSIGAILTGKMPSQLGLQHELRRLSTDAELLPEVMQRAGFRTAAVISNRYASTKWGFNQGYDAFDETAIKRRTQVTSDLVSDLAIEMLDRFDDEPLFLLVHYVDPHVSYQEHDDYIRWDAEYDGPIESPVHWEDLSAQFRRLESADWDRLRAVYNSEVAWTDAQVGRLFDHIIDTGRMDDAMVIFTHDHGEEFDDHGSIGHGYSLYEEQIAAPLIVHYPERFEVSVRVDTPVSLTDLFPTLLTMTNQPIPDNLEGRNLLGPLDPERAIRSETDRGGEPIRVVRIGDRKLIHGADRDRSTVYDLSSDPTEEDGVRPDRAARPLVDALNTWPSSELTAEAEPIDLDDLERQMLEAVGYLDGN